MHPVGCVLAAAVHTNRCQYQEEVSLQGGLGSEGVSIQRREEGDPPL